jgi:hypothetical protein
VVLGAAADIGAQAARSGLLVARAPEDPEYERILASSKSNLGPPLPALRYRIVARTPGSEVPAVEWLGACDYTAATLLGDVASGDAGTTAGRTTAVDEAAAWLRAQLAAGPRPAAALLAAAREEQGWSERTLRNARHLAEAKKYLVGFGGGGQWQWTLFTHDAETAPGTPSSNTAVSATSAISSTSVLPLSSGHQSDAAEPIEMDTPSSPAKDQEDAASGEE